MIRRAGPDDPLRVAVLVSGSGTNLEALLAAAGPAVSIVGVVSSRAGVRALERAEAAGVERAVLPRGRDRTARDEALAAWLEQRRVELVVLAGFMEILTPAVVERFPTINVHPSLLPAFPGQTAVEDALAYGVRVSGATVHLVDAGVDTGPILLQEPVPVLYDDAPDALRRRIQAVEHRLLPAAVALLAADRVQQTGRVTRVERLEAE